MAGEREKRKKAVALGYDEREDEAPRVLASGAGELAARIIRAAQEHGVPLKEDPSLVELLAGLDLHQEIPEELFRAVAEVLAWVYLMERGLLDEPGEEIFAPGGQ